MGKTEQVKRLAEYEWGKKNILLFHHGQRRPPPTRTKTYRRYLLVSSGWIQSTNHDAGHQTTAVGLY